MFNNDELSKISLRIPKKIIQNLQKLYPQSTLSEIIRSTLQQEIDRKKVMREHLKRYKKFKPEYFDESLL